MRRLQVAAGFLAAVVALLGSTKADAQWADEFNGSGAPSTGNWTRDLGGGGFGNNELQCYTDGSANANQTGGYLNIQARVQGSCDGRGYSSARLKTQGIRNFGPYGRLEARISGPMGQGLWPAFWTLGSNITSVPWPGCGEIDIMEHINTQGNTHGVIHWNGPAGYSYYTAAMPGVNFPAWNNYAVDWNSSRIQWQVNGGAVGEANIAGNINSTEEFHRSMFIILNLAVGGNWPGAPNGTTPFPANYNIDWVRVNGGGGTTPTPSPAGGPAGFTHCANENGTCSFSGMQSVAYGANGAFNYRMPTNSIACNNASFGDPIFGVAKACYRKLATHCANENGTCSFSGTQSVAYGANGSFSYRRATGSIACNNATFGDPIPGVVKSCYW